MGGASGSRTRSLRSRLVCGVQGLQAKDFPADLQFPHGLLQRLTVLLQFEVPGVRQTLEIPQISGLSFAGP